MVLTMTQDDTLVTHPLPNRSPVTSTEGTNCMVTGVTLTNRSPVTFIPGTKSPTNLHRGPGVAGVNDVSKYTVETPTLVQQLATAGKKDLP
jgi:hypothetical protein